MKILFVSDTYYPHINGVYYFVCRIGPILQERGHQIAVIAPSGTNYDYQKKIDDLDVYGLASFSVLLYPTIRIPIPLLLKSKIKTIIKNFNPDIIHIQDHFLISKAVIEVNKKLHIPIVATNHFMPENISVLVHGKKLKERVENFLWKDFSKIYNQVQIVTTPTETGANLIRPRLKVEVKAISSGISFERFNPFGNTDSIKEKYHIPDKPILLYVGRLDPEKRVEEILQAVAIAVKQIDFRFVIVGKGTKKESLEQLTNELGIADKVIFTGFVPDEDLPFFYKLSRCFIIASIAELLSLVTIQAMASGLPLIAVKAAALIELVKENANGYLYEEGDISSMVKHIVEIISNDELYYKMREKSIEFVQLHNINTTTTAFEKLYQEQIDKATLK